MNTKKYIYSIIVLAIIGSFALAVPALADDNQGDQSEDSDQKGLTSREQTKAVVGTVSAVSGNTVTVIGKQDSEEITTTVTFTVDATNANVTKNGVIITVSGIAVGDTVVVKGVVTGTNIVATTIRDGNNNQGETDSNKMSPAVVGKVSAINGNILTVVSNNKTASNTTTTFTVDATNAKLLRGNTAITLSNIAVGDNVVVQGTLTGTNVVATMIRDGKIGNGNNQSDNNQALSQIQGNGQPVIAGTVTALNGSTITVANANVTYAVDAANAKIVQGKNTILLSGVKTGDSVIVQGTVNGTSVTASTIIDQAKSANAITGEKTNRGFFSLIGQFFRRLFGF